MSKLKAMNPYWSYSCQLFIEVNRFIRLHIIRQDVNWLYLCIYDQVFDAAALRQTSPSMFQAQQILKHAKSRGADYSEQGKSTCLQKVVQHIN
jgi:hypothetical protein